MGIDRDEKGRPIPNVPGYQQTKEHVRKRPTSNLVEQLALAAVDRHDCEEHKPTRYPSDPSWELDLVRDELDRRMPAPAESVAPVYSHIAAVSLDMDSIRRGGSCRKGYCICGWVGPERSSLELAQDDAIQHERESDAVRR